MGQPREKGATPSAAPSRNFSLPAEERLRATAAGPPAHLRRLRAIEDLEARIVQLLAERDAEARAAHVDPDAYVHAHAPRRALERLADLI
ncbi:MAG: hypothetical protein FWD17_12645, partial [Polyangiaceae bacterium]|nr:hypothetical protein [Polyangiaceae bacterium]